MSEQSEQAPEFEEIPEPEGEYDDDYYDVAQWMNDEDGDELLDYGFFFRASDAIKEADRLNAHHKTNTYRPVKVYRETQYRPLRDYERQPND